MFPRVIKSHVPGLKDRCLQGLNKYFSFVSIIIEILAFNNYLSLYIGVNHPLSLDNIGT